MREKVAIRHDESAGELHDELMALGNTVVVETIKKIENGEVVALPQEEMAEGMVLKPAPKITKEFCTVDWSQECQHVYNHIRGLSPYPAAHTRLVSDNGEAIDMKVYSSEMEPCQTQMEVGNIVTDNKKYLKVAVKDGFIHLTMVQQAGKKAMPIADFLRGTTLNGYWKTSNE